MTRLLIGLGLVALCAWMYWPHRTADFVYQDWTQVESLGPGRPHPPLTWVRGAFRWSWWAQAQIAPRPLGFHLVNFGLHLLVGLLIAVLLSELGVSTGAVVFGTAAFLLHATAIETVAYAVERSELLAAIGVLTAGVLLAGEMSAWRVLGALAALAFGMAGKESAVIGVALVPLVAGFRNAALLVATAVSAGVAWTATARGSGTSVDWALTQLTAAWRLALLSVFPMGHTVDFDYERFTLVAQLVAVACLALAVGLAWRRSEQWGLVSLGVLWMALAVLPRLFFRTEGSPLNEHQFYLPLAGVAMIAAGAWEAA